MKQWFYDNSKSLNLLEGWIDLNTHSGVHTHMHYQMWDLAETQCIQLAHVMRSRECRTQRGKIRKNRVNIVIIPSQSVAHGFYGSFKKNVNPLLGVLCFPSSLYHISVKSSGFYSFSSIYAAYTGIDSQFLRTMDSSIDLHFQCISVPSDMHTFTVHLKESCLKYRLQ